jgi:phosphoserine phosphatase RsbU/P
MPRTHLDMTESPPREADLAPQSPPLPRRLLDHVLASLTDGVVVGDRDGRMVHFNPAAEQILGLGQLDVEEDAWSASYGCFGEDGGTPVPELGLPLSRAIRGETVYDEILFIRNRAHTKGVWISVNASPLRDESGELRGGIAVFRDVSTQREELDRTRMLSAAVDQTADSVIVTDENGVIEYVNPAASQITGFDPQELIGQTPRLFRSGVHDFAFYQALWATLAAGRVFRGTIVNRNKNGDLFHSEQTITPIKKGNGAVWRYVSVGKDVTELREAAEQTSRLVVARTVQQRLYPAAPPPDCGFDVAGSAFLADRTGGDYFDFLPLADGRLGLVVGDVSGKGIDAALVMVATRAYLRCIAEANCDPGTVLTRVNGLLCADLEEHQFVTMVVACVDRRTGLLSYASAGHVDGTVIDAGGALKARLPSTGPPLGIFRSATIPSAAPVSLEPGDTVIFVTDGLTEAEDARGEAFGEDRVTATARQLRSEPASRIVHQLYRAVRTFTGPAPQADDMTAVVCKPLAPSREHGPT